MQGNLIEQEAKNLIISYGRAIGVKGYYLTSPEKKQYHYEITIKDKSDYVKLLVYFGKKGIKTIIQGSANSGLYSEINKIVFGETLFNISETLTDEPEQYIGTDESGKGDYFGPLVICGVYVNKDTSSRLKSIGVRDSKELSDIAIRNITLRIKEIIDNNYDLVVLNPGKYNALHEKTGNVNKILGWGHARVLSNLLEKCEINEAISDKFGDDKYILNSLPERWKDIKLHQLTKGERYTAVAAASILARNRFCDWFDVQNKELGFELPKGASSSVEEAAKKIKNKFGFDKLNELVKLHFRTTLKII
ncbi:MAG: ribonuclease HIII [Ignavibacteriaceae bacterium]|nr:ribonuclease HIII [Ignavibacteriaceae bacterium]